MRTSQHEWRRARQGGLVSELTNERSADKTPAGDKHVIPFCEVRVAWAAGPEKTLQPPVCVNSTQINDDRVQNQIRCQANIKTGHQRSPLSGTISAAETIYLFSKETGWHCGKSLNLFGKDFALRDVAVERELIRATFAT